MNACCRSVFPVKTAENEPRSLREPPLRFPTPYLRFRGYTDAFPIPQKPEPETPKRRDCQVISEGLRVRPVVANNFKVVTRDVSIDGYVIPAGHNVTLNYRSIMRSEAFFPEPTAFKPERFDVSENPVVFAVEML